MVSLGESEPLKLYFDDGSTEPYTAADLLFQVDRATGVAVMTWNTPENLNCMAGVLLQETMFALEHAKRDPGVKALVWTGAGRAFSSGASLAGRKRPKVKWSGKVRKAYQKRGLWIDVLKDTAMSALTLHAWDFPKPLIGAINGLAVGGAANIALANYCDFVLCSEEAKFKYPFAKLGITPELGSSKMLPFLVGMVKAKELLLGGEWFFPKECLHMGLINSIHKPDELVPAALALALKYASVPNQAALRDSKRLINLHLREQMDKVMQTENTFIRACVQRGTPLQKGFGGEAPQQNGSAKL